MLLVLTVIIRKLILVYSGWLMVAELVVKLW